MNKLPDCPLCGLDELWLSRFDDGTREVRCYFCDWVSGPIAMLDGVSEADRIENVVAMACALQEGSVQPPT